MIFPFSSFLAFSHHSPTFSFFISLSPSSSVPSLFLSRLLTSFCHILLSLLSSPLPSYILSLSSSLSSTRSSLFLLSPLHHQPLLFPLFFFLSLSPTHFTPPLLLFSVLFPLPYLPSSSHPLSPPTFLHYSPFLPSSPPPSSTLPSYTLLSPPPHLPPTSALTMNTKEIKLY